MAAFGEAAVNKLDHAFFYIIGLAYFALGVVQLFAIAFGIVAAFDISLFWGYVCGSLLAWTPLLGVAAGAYGAHAAWGWSWGWSIAFFAWPTVFYIVGAIAAANTILRRVITVGLLVVIVAAIGFDLLITVVFRESAYGVYADRLDKWVASGGPFDSIEPDVVKNCGMLVVSQSGPVGIFLNVVDRSDFDFRVDVCVKVTANRVSPQPELQNPKIVSLICEGNDDLLRKLCVHAQLR